MTPKSKKFENAFQNTLRKNMDSNSVAECGESSSLGSYQITSFLVTKNSASAGLIGAAILPAMSRSRTILPRRCRLLTVHVYQIWFRSVEVRLSYSPKH